MEKQEKQVLSENAGSREMTIEEAISETVLLTEKEAAEFLSVKPGTMTDWRHRNPEMAPPYIKLGRGIRYRLDDLRAHMERNTVAPK